MFGFKTRSISQYIADPLASSTNIPVDSVIFYRGDMTSYAENANWNYIGTTYPSYVRGVVNPANAGLLYSKNITNTITFTSNGLHTGDTSYTQPYKQTGQNGNYNPARDGSSGNHTHTVTGLSGTNYLGGHYFAGSIVGLYKCVSPTKQLPGNTIILAKNVQNDDFQSIENTVFDDTSFIFGSSTWLTDNLNSQIYGSTNYRVYYDTGTIPFTTSTSGTHHHERINVYGDLYSSNGARTPNLTRISAGSHTHIFSIGFDINPAKVYYNGYISKRNTGVYKGMILGWVGTNPAVLPSGWYLCNGQTVNGVVTPSLNVDKFITINSNETLRGTVTGDDTASISGYSFSDPDPLSHTHYPGGDNNNIGYYSTYNAIHKDFDWAHTHTTSTTKVNYKQGYYTMNFIIYLG